MLLVAELFNFSFAPPEAVERGGRSEDTSRSGRRLRPLHPCFVSTTEKP